jgi:transcriptional regulator with XRE-family HTH domain
MDPKVIANRIRELRQQKEMTLEQLASVTGFSKGYLSRIENSSKPPPLFTLNTIAQALSTDITFLLSSDEPEDTSISVVRKDERKLVPRQSNPYQYTYEALAYKMAGKNMEPFLINVGFEWEKFQYQHRGEEFIFVLEGEMEFSHGDRRFRVREGDCLYFDASKPHSGVSVGDKEARILCVIYYYNRMESGHREILSRVG